MCVDVDVLMYIRCVSVGMGMSYACIIKTIFYFLCVQLL